MSEIEQLRHDLGRAMIGADSALAAADKLCHACVELLAVDGAAVSLMHEGMTQGTFGSSGELSRRLDEFQFTFGEGPCLDAMSTGSAVLVTDLADAHEWRWPAFRGAMLDEGVKAVFALPVTIASSRIGALDLFRKTSGPMAGDTLPGGLLAAKLASLPLIDRLSAHAEWESPRDETDGWDQLESLERVEVYQATGMIIGALDVSAAEALLRIRGHAFAHGMTASEVAWAIVERRLTLEDDAWRRGDGAAGPFP